MAEASLQDRLRDHAKAFDGLLSLIPAKMYYGEDNSDQWQRKKQTKQEAAAARRGKLDPDSELNRNAKEVMDERAKNKRKLREMEQEQQDDDDDDANPDESFDAPEGVEVEKPGEGLRRKTEESNKKQKLDAEKDNEAAESSEPALKLSKKEQKKAAKKEKKAEKKAEQKAKRADEPPTPAKEDVASTKDTNSTPASSKKQKAKKAKADATPSKPQPTAPQQVDEMDVDATPKPDAPALSLDTTMEEKPKDHEDEESASESDHPSPMFDMGEPEESVNGASAEPASTTTSISSAVPPSEKPKQIKIPADTTALKARLAAKIAALRAARKADGPDGKPIRTRQELIESRRVKQAQRKAHKKELRQQAKLEEERKREEALASNSPGVMSPAVELDENGSFSFGRVAFGDGSQMSHDLSYVLNQGKKKGPSDPKTALLKVQNQKKRLQELDSEKRGEIAEKEAWLTARRRIEGEKIRDDEAMLKKAVKRKETAKKKSEKAWKERARGVDQAQKERQKKREENLQKRRDEKAMGKAGKKKGGAKKKKGGRPGFEGSLGVAGRRK
ncbi:ribosome biogenesis protein Rrp14-C [Purpureocillium lilacinum]|uniref:Ribosome biogenesis protein Rrp14-C n=2 Tax=Purpureocillium lilacinum TaxID=33203 RepID=A0A179HUA2_PURLI|nr:ribosome biogenesis protein Rrp14-C [Purpureocillium lilacinum]OAQ93078.1 ribosome biogenesis protein Rrp14-C [Purpureocillium lilacinum]